MVKRPPPSPWMPMKTSFSCLEGLKPSVGVGAFPFPLPGLERKCLQIAGLDCHPVKAHRCQPTPAGAHAASLSLTLPSRGRGRAPFYLWCPSLQLRGICPR